MAPSAAVRTALASRGSIWFRGSCVMAPYPSISEYMACLLACSMLAMRASEAGSRAWGQALSSTSSVCMCSSLIVATKAQTRVTQTAEGGKG